MAYIGTTYLGLPMLESVRRNLEHGIKGQKWGQHTHDEALAVHDAIVQSPDRERILSGNREIDRRTAINQQGKIKSLHRLVVSSFPLSRDDLADMKVAKERLDDASDFLQRQEYSEALDSQEMAIEMIHPVISRFDMRGTSGARGRSPKSKSKRM